MNSEYEILKELNDTTSIAIKGNIVYIAKKINLNDVPLYKTLMQINNPNLVKIYELVAIENEFYAIEEYVKGITLKNFVENNNILSDDTIKNITLCICNGLRELHKFGIIHRDITPTNIMVDEYGNAKIIDFGISRFLKTNQTADTQLLGTPGFAPPEQYGFSQTNASSDVYSLGILINYMATGKLPNEKRATGFWGAIVTKCTEVDSSNRYPDILSLENTVNKNSGFNLFHNIIGFRQGKTSHMIIASIYYFICFVLFVAVIFGSDNVYDGVCTFMFISSLFILPVPIIFDFNNWTEKFKFVKSVFSGNKLAAKICGIILCVIYALVFILIDPVQ